MFMFLSSIFNGIIVLEHALIYALNAWVGKRAELVLRIKKMQRNARSVWYAQCGTCHSPPTHHPSDPGIPAPCGTGLARLCVWSWDAVKLFSDVSGHIRLPAAHVASDPWGCCCTEGANGTRCRFYVHHMHNAWACVKKREKNTTNPTYSCVHVCVCVPWWGVCECEGGG